MHFLLLLEFLDTQQSNVKKVPILYFWVFLLYTQCPITLSNNYIHNVFFNVQFKCYFCALKILKRASDQTGRPGQLCKKAFIDCPKNCAFGACGVQLGMVSFGIIYSVESDQEKKIDILGKWFTPENDQEKDLYAKMKKKEKSKEESSV